MQRWCENRLRNDNDVKVLVVGNNSETGIGKTTFALRFCRYIDPDFTARERAFVDVREYINAHKSEPPGSALLLDEIEAGADSRRFMSQENVDLSQAWATLRARNILTVATAPTVSMVDKRLLELADWWVLVKQRGVAQPYKINVNNFNGKVQRQALPGEEHIFFEDCPSTDQDKAWLDYVKHQMTTVGNLEYISVAEHEEELDKARKQARLKHRDEWLKALSESEMTLQDLADLEHVDVSRQRVHQIVSGTS